ncbi:MAG: hypothetical protein COV99_04190 [Bacteroidetes bacterium CG12_big_fil_rev_8_21_14_0_65_60_17]|nr:MAG: hypothetical protein COV99_04190 [Bacteroidetes bacterium CG12_big_fil_rev_8_21_14_0_65_60_17]
MTPDVCEVLSACAREWVDVDHPVRVAAVEATLDLDTHRFTEEAVAFAINRSMDTLRDVDVLRSWCRQLKGLGNGRRLAVLNPGHIPLVELQDLVAAVLAGFTWRGTVSSRSPWLLPSFLDELLHTFGGSSCMDAAVASVEDVLQEADLLIASGSDETMDIISGKAADAGIPRERCWLRGHRFSVAVLDGAESSDELVAASEDMLLHEGLGCRSAAIVFVPEDQSPDALLEALAVFRGTFPVHPKTSGALVMQKGFLAALDQPHAWGDGPSFLLSCGEAEEQGPGHIRWVPYGHPEEVSSWISGHRERLQSVYVREERLDTWSERCGMQVEQLGSAQRPPLSWCPDGMSHKEFFQEHF